VIEGAEDDSDNVFLFGLRFGQEICKF